jgi:hypothetical protein
MFTKSVATVLTVVVFCSSAQAKRLDCTIEMISQADSPLVRTNRPVFVRYDDAEIDITITNGLEKAIKVSVPRLYDMLDFTRAELVGGVKARGGIVVEIMSGSAFGNAGGYIWLRTTIDGKAVRMDGPCKATGAL